MSLREQQNLLAKLYTDPGYRSAFAADPLRVGVAGGLSPQEAEDISAASTEEIELFSESLIWKRAREVEKLLPATRRTLGNDFRPLFRTFSADFNPRSMKKHVEDAIEFCRFLRADKRVARGARDAADFEQKKLLFLAKNRRFLLARVKYDVDGPTRHRWLIIWVRWKGRVHRFGT